MRALAESLQEYVLSSENFLLNITPQLRRGYDLDIRRGSKITRLQLLLTADSADSTASSTVALFLLLISAMVLCSGMVYRKWSCASSMPSPRDNQLKSQ